MHYRLAHRGNLQNSTASPRAWQTICSPSLPSSFLPYLPSSLLPLSHPPLQQLQGSGDVGAPCSETGERERKRHEKKSLAESEGEVREKRQSCDWEREKEQERRKIKILPLPALVDNDTGRVISKQWARKRRSATAIHPPKHDTQSAPRHNRIHLWENGAGLIKCVAERSYYKNSPFESSQSYWWKSGLRSCSAALLLHDFYWNVFNLCICKMINKCVELVRLINHHIAKTELAYTRQQKGSTASERRHFKWYNT